jgi:hypothetical protein
MSPDKGLDKDSLTKNNRFTQAPYSSAFPPPSLVLTLFCARPPPVVFTPPTRAAAQC